MKVRSVNDVFDEMLGGIDYTPSKGEIFCRVACIRARHPTHEYFQFILNMGSSLLPRILDKTPLESNIRKPDFCIALVFPERHLSVHGQYALMGMLYKNPSITRFKQLDLITSSPILIGNFQKEAVRVCRWEDDVEKYE
ncbi:MAG: hypothetical protein DRI65_06120 [Chloroflexota bacterium]|nr:MAG: hypothetical protein DRI65_06120 [Chloroflexota bacterium]